MKRTSPSSHGITQEQLEHDRLLEHVRRIRDSNTATIRMEKQVRAILYAVAESRDELEEDEWRRVLGVVLDFIAGESARLLPDELEEAA